MTIGDGALVPWSVGNGGFYDSIVQAICDRYEIDPDTAWRDLTTEQQDLFLDGTKGDKLYVQYRNRMGRRRSYTMAFEGIVASLERRYKETDSSQQRERIEEYMSFRPCPTCGGATGPEVLAVTVGGESIHSFTRMSVTRALAFLDELGLTPTEELIGHGSSRRSGAADLPGQRRRGLPPARPGRQDALRAARRSGCGWRRRSARSSSVSSTSSTSRRSGCTSATTTS